MHIAQNALETIFMPPARQAALHAGGGAGNLCCFYDLLRANFDLAFDPVQVDLESSPLLFDLGDDDLGVGFCLKLVQRLRRTQNFVDPTWRIVRYKVRPER